MLVITQNKKILVPNRQFWHTLIKVSHKGYSKDPRSHQISRLVWVYLQSNRWSPLACLGRHHDVKDPLRISRYHALQPNKLLLCYERYSVEEPSRLTNSIFLWTKTISSSNKEMKTSSFSFEVIQTIIRSGKGRATGKGTQVFNLKL